MSNLGQKNHSVLFFFFKPMVVIVGKPFFVLHQETGATLQRVCKHNVALQCCIENWELLDLYLPVIPILC